MTKLYGINIHISHVVYVEADSLEEAEEYAFDQFSDEAGFWDMVDLDVLSEEEI